MTEVDFYILQEDTLAARDHFACRLAEKAMNTGRQVVIAVEDKDHGESLSEYLWSFKPESFIPHCLNNTGDEQGANTDQVMIEWQEPSEACHDVLINLKQEIPPVFSRFKRLTEIVIQHPDQLAITRSHFQFYRDRGYPLKSHKIN